MKEYVYYCPETDEFMLDHELHRGLCVWVPVLTEVGLKTLSYYYIGEL